MERDITLRDGRMLHICRPRGKDAAEMLDYLKIIGGETDFLLFGAAGLPYTPEQEAEVLEGFYNDPRGGFFIGRIDGEIACSFNLACNRRARIAHVAEIAVAVGDWRGSNAWIVENVLVGAVAHQDLAEFDDVRVLFAELVSCSVTADHDVLRHVIPSRV